MGTNAKDEEESKKIISEIMVAQEELNALKREHGLEEEEKGIKKWISKFFEAREARRKQPLSKKKYLLLAVFLGAFGAHRFYAKQYPTAIIYLLTCWTGFSFAMTLIDLIIAIPMQKDEQGNIFI